MREIDTSIESLITVTLAAKQIPGRPHVATVWRWILHGLNGIRLESVKVGGRRFTSEEAIQRFIAQMTAAANGESMPLRSPSHRQRSIERAERELAEDGI